MTFSRSRVKGQVRQIDSEPLKRFQPKLTQILHAVRRRTDYAYTRSCIQRSRSQTTFFKKCTFLAKASVLSIATKKCKFVKASASGWLCPHPRTRGVPLYPAGGITNHISRPSWLHELYNTSRASGCMSSQTIFVLIDCTPERKLGLICDRRRQP